MVFYPQPPPASRGRGLGRGSAHHTYTYTPYGRGRGSENVLPPRPKSAQADLPRPRFEVDGVTFELVQNGSKLKRITAPDANLPTPLRHEIAGIKFFRTKGGNLLRQREYLELQEKQLARRTLCPKFTRTGQCSRDCKFNHDPDKTAACKSYLHKRSCPAGSSCLLSHDLTPQRTPLCIYFARGNCTNPRCQYVHAAPKEDALVCEGFARLGYCEAGSECPNLHVFECPAYANTGTCDAEKCYLPHVQRAGQLRRLNGSSVDPSSNDHSEAEHEDAPVAAAAAPAAATASANVGFYVDIGRSDSDVANVRPDADADASQSAFSKQEDFIRL